MEHDPLDVDPETMRRLGYQTVDWLVDRAVGRRDEPVLVQATPAEMAERVSPDCPAEGRDLAEVLAHLGEDVLPYRSRIDHPRYLAYVPGEGTWPGALGDLVASTYNIDAGNWMESSGPSHLEQVVLRWFADWIGYPAEAQGVLVSGGSAANLTAMACARESLVGAMRDDLVVYVSAQSHSSLARAARLLGFGPEQVRVLPVDDEFRMRPEALAAAIDADLDAGLRPLLVLAVAGTTNTGSVDDLPALAEICHRHEVWLHVDGAYGAFAALTERGRDALRGLDLADSVTLDPHKWLYQPFEVGAVLVRRGHLLKQSFEIHPDYLQDTEAHHGEVNFADRGLQLTRMSRAVKLWMSLQYFGRDAFAAAIDRAMDLAEHAQRTVESSDELELLSPATLGIVAFRRRPPGVDDEPELERVNSGLVADLAASGVGLVSSTRLMGSYAIRLCVLNHSTTEADVDRVLTWLTTADVTTTPPQAAGSPAYRETKTVSIATGWSGPAGVDLEELRSQPLLHEADAEQLQWLTLVARRRTALAGETVVRQWGADRDFYLLLDGEAEVHGMGSQLGVMGPGDFFGELAALEWGAGYAYPRLATVRARTDLALIVIGAEHLAALMARAPSVDRQVRAAVAHRSRRI